MVDSVMAGTLFCQFILSRQIDGNEPRRLVISPMRGIFTSIKFRSSRQWDCGLLKASLQEASQKSIFYVDL
jgi:hypothetical protein